MFNPTVLPDHPFIHAHKRAYAEIVSREYSGFSIRRIEVTVFGVMVLVDGDAMKAQQELVALGASGVRRYDPHLAAVGSDEQAQIEQMVDERLTPLLRYARRELRGVTGSAGIGLWRDAGAILVQWKAPVPEEVRALEDIFFKTGGRIIVEAVRYSTRDSRDAGQRLLEMSQAERFSAEVFSTSLCADGSGLVARVDPEVVKRRRAELQRQLSEVAGMPVHVVPGEGVVHLPATVSTLPSLPSE